MKILVSAFACRPGAGSEWHVGWQTVRALAGKHELWVLTHAFNRRDIEDFLRAEPIPNVHFRYFGEPVRWHGNRLVARMQDWAELRSWTRKAARIAREMHREIRFDIGHHATIATWRVASPLAGVGPRWVWGPIGGATSVPMAFLSQLSAGARAFELVRGIANVVGLRSPALRRCARDASVVLVNSHETLEAITKLRGSARNVSLLSQTFLSTDRFLRLSRASKRFPEAGETVEILACGTLEGLKGVALTLRALARCGESGLRFRFRFLGKGSELGHLQALAERLGLAGCVRLGDWIDGDAYAAALEGAHLYVSPSLREGVPVSLIEAMAAGCVPVVARCGGPGLVVENTCGVALPLSEPNAFIGQLAGAILELSADVARCRRMSEIARRRIGSAFTDTTYTAGIEAAFAQALAEPPRACATGGTAQESLR